MSAAAKREAARLRKQEQRRRERAGVAVPRLAPAAAPDLEQPPPPEAPGPVGPVCSVPLEAAAPPPDLGEVVELPPELRAAPEPEPEQPKRPAPPPPTEAERREEAGLAALGVLAFFRLGCRRFAERNPKLLTDDEKAFLVNENNEVRQAIEKHLVVAPVVRLCLKYDITLTVLDPIVVAGVLGFSAWGTFGKALPVPGEGDGSAATTAS